MSAPRVVGVVQARMGSTRLPGKVLEQIGGRPLVLRTLAALQAVPSVDAVVLATTVDPTDDRLAELGVDAGVAVHRGSVHDVLTRVHEALAPFDPSFVVRATADNPFPDPTIIDRQVQRAVGGGLDYLGIGDWPLGIAAEIASWTALSIAHREATTAAEREHVLPFVYARPDRFRVAGVRSEDGTAEERYTVDTAADLAFARALADRLGDDQVPVLDTLRTTIASEPTLADLNRGVHQRAAQEAEIG